jgi:cephalosporin-C deacetylase-like acetyl esterase
VEISGGAIPSVVYKVSIKAVSNPYPAYIHYKQVIIVMLRENYDEYMKFVSFTAHHSSKDGGENRSSAQLLATLRRLNGKVHRRRNISYSAVYGND